MWILISEDRGKKKKEWKEVSTSGCAKFEDYDHVGSVDEQLGDRWLVDKQFADRKEANKTSFIAIK